MKKIVAKNIITKSDLPWVDFVINPYVWCWHWCIYCYADFMKKFYEINEKWGTFVYPKDFKIPEIWKKYDNRSIFISSVTDSYQPVEKKYKKMRWILWAFKDSKAKISILTKSDLVLRDIDLIKQIKNIEVWFSISHLSNWLKKHIEPWTSNIEDRIDALKILKENWIKTYIFMAPLWPWISNTDRIVELTHNFVDYYMADNLRLKFNNKKIIFDLIKKYFPKLFPLYQEIYNKDDFNYWQEENKKLLKLSKQYNKKIKVYFK